MNYKIRYKQLYFLVQNINGFFKLPINQNIYKKMYDLF